MNYYQDFRLPLKLVSMIFFTPNLRLIATLAITTTTHWIETGDRFRALMRFFPIPSKAETVKFRVTRISGNSIAGRPDARTSRASSAL